MQLERTLVSRRYDGRAVHHLHQDTEGVRTRHVRVHDIETLLTNPSRDSEQFGCTAVEFGFEDVDLRVQMFLQPATAAAKDCDLMTTLDQLFRKKLAIRNCAINVAPRNDLQDIQWQ